MEINNRPAFRLHLKERLVLAANKLNKLDTILKHKYFLES